MPEQLQSELPEPIAPPFDPETSPLTYSDVLNHPDTPDVLKPDLERKVAQEAMAQGVRIVKEEAAAEAPEAEPRNRVELMTDELKSHLEDNGYKLRSGHHQMYAKEAIMDLTTSAIVRAYREDDPSTSQLADLLHAAVELQDALDAQKMHERDMVAHTDYSRLRTAIRMMPADKVEEMYFSEEYSGDLRKVLDEAAGYQGTEKALLTLKNIYHADTLLDLAADSMASSDPIVQRLLREPKATEVMIDALTEDQEWLKKIKPEDQTRVKRDYADRLLGERVGLPKELRDDILFASYARTSNEETGEVNSVKLRSHLKLVAQRVEELGVERAQRLREKTGIVNLEYYTKDDLELMSVIAKDEHEMTDEDREIIKHLQDGDVTVVFVDAKGDHNGAFRANSSKYATESKRTLFFEINEKGDFYDHMVRLRRLRIKPSTCVISAHGSPGLIAVGNPNDNREWLYNDTSDSEMVAWRGIPRFVDSFMQDSRGIDDNEEAIGRRRIVLDACSQAVPAPIYRRTEVDGKLVIDKSEESNAETLVKTMNNPKVDLYAGKGILSSQSTARGLTMTEHIEPTTENGKWQQRPLPVTHMRIDDHGNMIEQQVDELILRRKSGLDFNSDSSDWEDVG